MIRVAIADRQDHIKPDRRMLRRLVREVLTGERVHDAEISLALVDDATIRELHRRYLHQDTATDVLSFALSSPDAPPLHGEIVISTPTAQAAARRLGRTTASELYLYVIHGLLHLCGYDDQLSKDRRRMRIRESYYLTKLSLERGNQG
jgi:probable rRNA maturation factor